MLSWVEYEKSFITLEPGLRVIKLLLWSTQLSMKFILPIHVKMPTLNTCYNISASRFYKPWLILSSDCVFEGQRVHDGQTFVRPGDNCQQCTCSRGSVNCQSLGPCPALQCTVTETPPGACCPQCKRKSLTLMSWKCYLLFTSAAYI